MSPFIMEKRLEETEDGFVIRLTREEVASMALNPAEPVQVHLSEPHAAWERIGGTDPKKESGYQSLW